MPLYERGDLAEEMLNMRDALPGPWGGALTEDRLLSSRSLQFCTRQLRPFHLKLGRRLDLIEFQQLSNSAVMLAARGASESSRIRLLAELLNRVLSFPGQVAAEAGNVTIWD